MQSHIGGCLVKCISVRVVSMDKYIDCMPNIDLAIALTKYKHGMFDRGCDKTTMKSEIETIWNLVCAEGRQK